MNQLNKYTRPDGVTGFGFEIEHAGRPMHSIAWPDRVGERMKDDERQEKRIGCEPFAMQMQGVGIDPAAPGTEQTVEHHVENPVTRSESIEPGQQSDQPGQQSDQQAATTNDAVETPPADQVATETPQQ